MALRLLLLLIGFMRDSAETSEYTQEENKEFGAFTVTSPSSSQGFCFSYTHFTPERSRASHAWLAQASSWWEKYSYQTLKICYRCIYCSQKLGLEDATQFWEWEASWKHYFLMSGQGQPSKADPELPLIQGKLLLWIIGAGHPSDNRITCKF